jgi:serine/threonine protein kinase
VWKARWEEWGYEIVDSTPLGSGAFGLVYRARVTKPKAGLNTGDIVAIKELADGTGYRSNYFHKPDEAKERDPYLLLNTTDEFVKLFDSLKDSRTGYSCLVFELCEGGSLTSALAKTPAVTNDQLRKLRCGC